MSGALEQSKKKLRLVEPRHELSGKFPRAFERAARGCSATDNTHHALLFAVTTVARRGLSECLPPTLAQRAKERLSAVEGWARKGTTLKQVQQLRAQTYEELPDFEQRTLQVLKTSGLSARETTDFDPHADAVVERYVALSVHHALGAVLLCCDALLTPTLVLEVPAEVASALAYRNVALGPARQEALRQSALDNAAWEAQRVRASARHGQAALALQLWHEYLGVHWKNHVDAQRLYIEQFLQWAFAES